MSEWIALQIRPLFLKTPALKFFAIVLTSLLFLAFDCLGLLLKKKKRMQHSHQSWIDVEDMVVVSTSFRYERPQSVFEKCFIAVFESISYCITNIHTDPLMYVSFKTHPLSALDLIALKSKCKCDRLAGFVADERTTPSTAGHSRYLIYSPTTTSLGERRDVQNKKTTTITRHGSNGTVTISPVIVPRKQHFPPCSSPNNEIRAA